MSNTAFIAAAILWLCLMVRGAAQQQVSIDRDLYQIVSGTYSQAGGIFGGWSESLPSGLNAYVALSTHRGTQTSQLTFLDRNRRSNLVPPSVLTLSNGTVSGEQIRFNYVTTFPMGPTNHATINYTVATDADTIVVDGSVDISYTPCLCSCADCITGYQHVAVRAILVPVVSIRSGDRPELCWTTAVNRSYQVYYATDLTTNAWMSWEGPIAGTGTTVCVPIPVATNQQVFYRVAAIP